MHPDWDTAADFQHKFVTAMARAEVTKNTFLCFNQMHLNMSAVPGAWGPAVEAVFYVNSTGPVHGDSEQQTLLRRAERAFQTASEYAAVLEGRGVVVPVVQLRMPATCPAPQDLEGRMRRGRDVAVNDIFLLPPAGLEPAPRPPRCTFNWRSGRVVKRALAFRAFGVQYLRDSPFVERLLSTAPSAAHPDQEDATSVEARNACEVACSDDPRCDGVSFVGASADGSDAATYDSTVIPDGSATRNGQCVLLQRDPSRNSVKKPLFMAPVNTHKHVRSRICYAPSRALRRPCLHCIVT
jgi:hypothetical protein